MGPGGTRSGPESPQSKPRASSTSQQTQHSPAQTHTSITDYPALSGSPGPRFQAVPPPLKATGIISRPPSLQLSDKSQCAEGMNCTLEKTAVLPLPWQQSAPVTPLPVNPHLAQRSCSLCSASSAGYLCNDLGDTV